MFASTFNNTASPARKECCHLLPTKCQTHKLLSQNTIPKSLHVEGKQLFQINSTIRKFAKLTFLLQLLGFSTTCTIFVKLLKNTECSLTILISGERWNRKTSTKHLRTANASVWVIKVTRYRCGYGFLVTATEQLTAFVYKSSARSLLSFLPVLFHFLLLYGAIDLSEF